MTVRPILRHLQLLVGEIHPITVAIARMHPDYQDVIDDFLLEVATRGLSLRGRFISHFVQRAVSEGDQATEQGSTKLVPSDLLKMAKWQRRDPER